MSDQDVKPSGVTFTSSETPGVIYIDLGNTGVDRDELIKALGKCKTWIQEVQAKRGRRMAGGGPSVRVTLLDARKAAAGLRQLKAMVGRREQKALQAAAHEAAKAPASVRHLRAVRSVS